MYQSICQYQDSGHRTEEWGQVQQSDAAPGLMISVGHCPHETIDMSRSLHEAVRSNNVEEVIIRLNLGEDINQRYPPR